ncbi:MAG: ATP phosphoribosyltransferase regulatory subunit [Pseudomonadales bacterium]
MTDYRWQLPDGVDELLPPMARQMEHLRREVLDVFHRWGFDLIDPPVIEYLDSLLVGSGNDLDLQTLKAVDQRSGRQLGVRADMTSQAVRIDAQRTRERPANAGVARLCYSGAVVHANPSGVHESRVPIKAGAEIFGAPDLDADAEIVALMLDVLGHGGIDDPVLVLGHMGIYNALVANADLDDDQRSALFSAVQIKSESDIANLLPAGSLRDQLVALPNLMGNHGVLDEARKLLPGAPKAALAALDALAELSERVLARMPAATLRFDLAELAGFGYHNGPIYSAYHSQLGRALARGGRYDGLGSAFGAQRSATGFDVSLRPLLATQQSFRAVRSIWVSHDNAAIADTAGRDALWRKIAELRNDGQRVVVALSAADNTAPQECDRECLWRDGQWQIESRSN